jgi:hypothetical protein
MKIDNGNPTLFEKTTYEARIKTDVDFSKA